MTPDQAIQLATKISEAKIQLRTIATEHAYITTDEYAANQTIANLRLKLAEVDQQLFSLYRLIDSFMPRQSYHPTRHTPTIDDLDI